jgi:hypothetical protein
MISRRLKVVILILSAALLEDTSLFRSAGQWAAFALAQGIVLACWRKRPIWLAIVAGVRFSDLFTDVSYVLAVPSLTTLGWICLLPPPLLNLVGVVIMLRGYQETRTDIMPKSKS